jgi:hypothetical protein
VSGDLPGLTAALDGLPPGVIPAELTFLHPQSVAILGYSMMMMMIILIIIGLFSNI